MTTSGESSLARRKTWSEVRYFARERTDGREAFHGLEVVIENLRRSVEHELDAPILRVEIGHEHFDDD